MVAGCHDDVPPPVTPVAYEAPPPPAPPPAPAAAPPQVAATAVNVSKDILDLCHIQDSRTGKDPLFAFDSSALTSADQRLLGEVAQCLTGGALAGRAIKLTGRADPRGTEAYNMNLGEKRATRVAKFLERRGLPSTNITEVSRGALDATGNDENSWMNDRRVDVELAG